jgi:hypothetical protein
LNEQMKQTGHPLGMRWGSRLIMLCGSIGTSCRF